MVIWSMKDDDLNKDGDFNHQTWWVTWGVPRSWGIPKLADGKDDLGYPHIVVDIMVPIWYIIGILGYIGILIPIMYSDIHIYYD